MLGFFNSPGRYRHYGLMLWGLFLLALVSPHACADDSAPMTGPQSIDLGREALRDNVRFPWYDASEDSLRRVDVKPPREAAIHRDSTWRARITRRDNSLNLSGWDTFWRIFWQVVEVVIWILLALLLVSLAILLARAMLRMTIDLDAEHESEASQRDGRSEADLIENLPFQVKRPQSDLLGEARRHYEQGEYSEAIIYLFSYQLVQLDKSHLIQLTRGKTNRQYLREIWSRREVRRLVERTMITFEDVFFGHHPLDRDGFEACWSRLDDFHQALNAKAT